MNLNKGINNLSPLQEAIIRGKVCPYCKIPSVLIESKEVYGKDYGKLYICNKCQAYVGCHKGTENALGRLANKELRRLKMEAHKYFDQLWKGKKNRKKARTEAYRWLSRNLVIQPEFTHIGMFSENTLIKVIELSKNKLKIK